MRQVPIMPSSRAMSSINTKVGVAFLLAALVLIGAGATVALNSTRLGGALDGLRSSATVLRQHTLADMFHDALRGDVYAALYNATKSKDGLEQDRRQVAEDAASFRKTIDTLSREAVSPEAKEALARLRPVLEGYIAQADRIVNLAYADHSAAEQALPEFVERFEALGKAMEEAGDVIEAGAHAIEDDAQDSRRAAALQSGAAGALVLVMLLAGFLWIRRQFVIPVRGLATSIIKIKDGGDIDLPGRGRSDEIGEVARAIDHISSLGRDTQLTVHAMNASDTLLMITDPDERIVFISAKLCELLMTLEPAFRAARHDFAVEKMTGEHLDYYRANPALSRKLLSDDGKKRKVRYEVGNQVLLVDMTYIHDIEGRKIGHTLLWHDATAEIAGQVEIAAVIAAAQKGDFSARLDVAGKSGFVKDMAAGLNELAELVEGAVEECAAVMQAVADGDLTHTVASAFEGSLGALASSINDTVARLSETVSTIQATSVEVSGSAREINAGADDLSRRTEEQASSLEQTAATTEELAASVKASAQSSRQAVDLAEEAMKVAQTGGTIVTQAVEAMTRIEQASQKITDITSVIDDIAFQTNLLALNAAVEAARAGEAGKGFAVVASEVRTLAQRSSDAAKDITGLINTSTTEVAQGVKLVRSAGDALGKIVDASQKVASTVSEISAASSEQANGIDEMSQAVAHMDEMTQQNAALAEESAASAGSLSSQIQRLNDLVATFRTGQGHVPLQQAASRAPTRSAPTEPDRLRKLASDAFAQRAEPPRATKPAPRTPTAQASRKTPPKRAAGGKGWEEF
jgi:methyl-accepting chemotaxis protein